MELENLNVYELSIKLGEDIWKIVNNWNNFEKDTIGKQIIKSADSVAANISKGFGRYHYKETKSFGYYSRGSLFETKTWLRKAFNRNLIEPEFYSPLISDIELIGKMLNNYIKSIGKIST